MSVKNKPICAGCVELLKATHTVREEPESGNRRRCCCFCGKKGYYSLYEAQVKRTRERKENHGPEN